MKKILLTFLLLKSITSFSQLRDSVYVKSDVFEMVYSEKLENPKWIKYTVQCPQGKASRKGLNFYTCDSIHTSDDADYENNVYDKGHMAPAADFSCTVELLKKTFTYLNCSIQNQYLNRGVWRLLEEYERQLTKLGEVKVTITLYFDDKKLPTGAYIPVGFHKTIEYNGKTECYYFPNIKPESSDYRKYQCK